MSAREIRSRVAHAGFDDHRWFGHSVRSMIGDETLLGLVMLSACGRRPSPEERRLLEDISVILTVADPRIWPLKIARIVASYGSMMAGLGASQLCVESDALGPWIGAKAAELLMDVERAAGDDPDDATFARAAREVLERQPVPFGYGVPLRERDERYLALAARLEELGRASLPWWSLQQRLTAFVRSERSIEPNAGIGVAAALLDMGLGPDAARVLTVFAMGHLFLAQAAEGAGQAAPILQELPVESVRWVGPAPRKSPRAG